MDLECMYAFKQFSNHMSVRKFTLTLQIFPLSHLTLNCQHKYQTAQYQHSQGSHITDRASSMENTVQIIKQYVSAKR